MITLTTIGNSIALIISFSAFITILSLLNKINFLYKEIDYLENHKIISESLEQAFNDNITFIIFDKNGGQKIKDMEQLITYYN